MIITWGAIAVFSAITVLVGLSLYLPLSAGDVFLLPISTLAVGAYGYGYLATHGYGLLVSALIGVAAATALAAIVGLLALPFRGLGTSLVTLAFVEIVGIFLSQFRPFGGSVGLPGIPSITVTAIPVAACAILVVAAFVFEMSRFGDRLRAVRADDLAAECLGINSRRMRFWLSVASGAVSGLAGVFLAGYLTYIDPTQFSVTALNSYLPATILGGSTSALGSLVGGIVTGALPSLLQGLQTYEVILYSCVVLLVLLVRRDGIITYTQLRRLVRWLSPRPTAEAMDDDPLCALSLMGGADLRLEDVIKHYGGIHAVDGVTVDISGGTTVGLIGPNGAGKTTLLNLISGVENCDTGAIYVDGVRCRGRGAHRRVAVGIARTFQNLRLYTELTARENVALVSRLRARALLDLVGLTEVADRQAGELSYGQQRRLEIARALASRPKVLLLDEPTAGMTTEESSDIARLLLDMRTAAGPTVIVIEHNVEFIAAIAERVLVLDGGRAIADGTAREVAGDPVVLKAYFGDTVSAVDAAPASGTN